MHTCADPATLRARWHRLDDTVEPALEPLHEPVAEIGEPDGLGVALGVGELQGDRSGDDAGDVLRAAAPLAFLSAADDQRVDAWPATFDQHADALRAAELVGRLSDSRSTCGVTSRRSSQQAACTASVCTSAPGASRRTSSDTCGDVGDRADLVVDGHHADDGDVGLVVEHRSEFVEIDAAGSIDADDTTAETLDDVEHRVMLHGRADRNPAVP